MKSPILCLVGLSWCRQNFIRKSIADALGRKYIRLSLGGLILSEIRGHRKTYIGAMAGRIIQSIKKYRNIYPVVVLDEIDKLGMEPTAIHPSALLRFLIPNKIKVFTIIVWKLGMI